jgi:flagellar hook-length control protein FliK
MARLDLAEQTESALARMRVNQLSSLNQDRPGSPEWLVELPVRRGEQIDTWQLHVRRDGTAEQANNSPDDGRWSAVLQFDLPNLGAMEARVHLTGETISSVFIAETEGAVPVVKKQLPHLRSRLQALGLEVARLGCRQGKSSTLPRAAQSGSLLDEQV